METRLVKLLSYRAFFPLLFFSNFLTLFIYQERTGLLLLFSIMIGIMILWHFIGAIVISIWGVEESKILVKELGATFLKLIYEWDTNPRSSRILRQIQEYVSSSFLLSFRDLGYHISHKGLA